MDQNNNTRINQLVTNHSKWIISALIMSISQQEIVDNLVNTGLSISEANELVDHIKNELEEEITEEINLRKKKFKENVNIVANFLLEGKNKDWIIEQYTKDEYNQNGIEDFVDHLQTNLNKTIEVRRQERMTREAGFFILGVIAYIIVSVIISLILSRLGFTGEVLGKIIQKIPIGIGVSAIGKELKSIGFIYGVVFGMAAIIIYIIISDINSN